jgi:glucokinase
MMRAIAGLDIGGTTTRVAVVSGGSRAIRNFPTAVNGPADLGGHIIECLEATMSQGGITQSKLDGVAVGLPGTVDGGTVRLASNLGLDHNQFALATVLEDALDTPVAIENDVKMAALGLSDELPDPKNGVLTYISVGTGVASATVVDGNILRGVHGSAGEIGQMRIVPAGPEQSGALAGSLEAVASGRAVSTAGGVDSAATHLAIGIHMLWMTFDPDAVVIGGGVAQNPAFSTALVDAIEDLRSQSSVTRSIIDMSRIRFLGSDAMPGIDGALHLASQISLVSDGLRPSAIRKETP